MTKLINAFRAVPTAANRTKLAVYLRRHSMATCFATQEELIFLRTHEFI